MRAFTVSCTHSLTLTLTGFGGGGIAQLVSTAVADAQLLSYKKRPKHVEYVSHFPQIDFPHRRLLRFLKLIHSVLSNDDDDDDCGNGDGGGDSNNSTTSGKQ